MRKQTKASNQNERSKTEHTTAAKLTPNVIIKVTYGCRFTAFRKETNASIERCSVALNYSIVYMLLWYTEPLLLYGFFMCLLMANSMRIFLVVFTNSRMHWRFFVWLMICLPSTQWKICRVIYQPMLILFYWIWTFKCVVDADVVVALVMHTQLRISMQTMFYHYYYIALSFETRNINIFPLINLIFES